MGFKGQASGWQHGPTLMLYYHSVYYYYYYLRHRMVVEPVLTVVSHCMQTLLCDQKLRFQNPAGLFQMWGGQGPHHHQSNTP